jgi:16S rRNA processing protein RimM
VSEHELVRVATLGAPHGLRGEIRLRVHTDDPGRRLLAGASFVTDPPDVGPLEVETVREGSGATYARFAGIDDRTAAETLRDVVLLAEPLAEDDAWYPEDLQGLRAELTDGTVVGEVIAVQHLPAQDVLVVRETDGARTQIPFVTAIVPVVDVAGGRVVLDPPTGLLARDQPDATDEP